MRGPLWTRLAAGTGIAFVAIAASLMIIAEINDFANSADFAIQAGDQMWASYTLLIGFAAVFFFWFTATLAARLRQLEWGYGGSGRLAATVFSAGTVIAAALVLQVGVQFATRQGDALLGTLATSLLQGPTLAFPIAAYIVATGVVGIRSEGLPDYSRWLALLSVPTGAWFLASAGLQLFYNYAWLDETATIVFLVWVLALSIIGVYRWAELDEVRPTPPARPAARAAPPPPEPEPEPEFAAPARPRRPARARKKAAPRKRAPRKR